MNELEYCPLHTEAPERYGSSELAINEVAV